MHREREAQKWGHEQRNRSKEENLKNIWLFDGSFYKGTEI
jgi:hypothetical protein